MNRYLCLQLPEALLPPQCNLHRRKVTEDHLRGAALLCVSEYADLPGWGFIAPFVKQRSGLTILSVNLKDVPMVEWNDQIIVVVLSNIPSIFERRAITHNEMEKAILTFFLYEVR